MARIIEPSKSKSVAELQRATMDLELHVAEQEAKRNEICFRYHDRDFVRK